MMSELGKKKNVKIFSAAVALIFVLSIAGLAVMQMGNPVNAAPSSNIGVIDMSKVITPDNQDAVDAQKQWQQAGEDMQKQFEEQSANMTDDQKQELFQKMQGDLAKKHDEIYKGVKDKVDSAISSVANTKSLSLVVDKRVVLYGGTDITDQVTKQLGDSQSK
ncbi:DNA-binding protein [Megasphaera cerevisiae DSM 20462]|mgnify:CR=1 FL=1|jgi:outer membrane protein|uniref:DNA-binding protein n=1 Tax=Megasphaera cerevisiae DSM 20462 TaxID=1122219 RepID=A0A0J6WWV7_9FIRM|nr:OmpH family outer membrane protein [Megasphaera cerevisiae]KMO86703.1 DNA-binding protein [Megasphaera cerevisiae DSM 20462]MCI1750592.1 OmpH family outer membrane protein [Megasphaera cerevisiae]OKY53300.1 DNA-binding protein [Megasphaera cerevisiae]SJZ86223.1 periplasmic chaperone for outer membrane proteins Skp [Megasphaera cerevisiae DSM 20462]